MFHTEFVDPVWYTIIQNLKMLSSSGSLAFFLQPLCCLHSTKKFAY